MALCLQTNHLWSCFWPCFGRRPCRRIPLPPTPRVGFPLAQPPQLLPVRPDDPQTLGGRLASLQPATEDPIAQLQHGYSQLLCQVPQPPLVLSQLIRILFFVRQATPREQGLHGPLCEQAAFL